jgi:hypothetical protein
LAYDNPLLVPLPQPDAFSAHLLRFIGNLSWPLGPRLRSVMFPFVFPFEILHVFTAAPVRATCLVHSRTCRLIFILTVQSRGIFFVVVVFKVQWISLRISYVQAFITLNVKSTKPLKSNSSGGEWPNSEEKCVHSYYTHSVLIIRRAVNCGYHFYGLWTVKLRSYIAISGNQQHCPFQCCLRFATS